MHDVGTVLSDVTFEGWFLCESRLSSPWGLALPGGRLAAIHAVLDGSCRIDLDGGASAHLRAGDIAFLPRDFPHRLRSDADAEVIAVADLPDIDRSERRFVRLDYGGGNAVTSLLTASFRTEEDIPQVALSGMAPLEVISAASYPKLGTLIDFCRAEHNRTGFGHAGILRRLCELLFISILQTLGQAGSEGAGWLSALSNPKLGRVIGTLHDRPGARWTLDGLAELAGMSRSSFAEAFRRAVGVAPIDYLTRLRMDRAAVALSRGRDPIPRIAVGLGYSSVPSFTRAFRTAHGATPARYRAMAYGATGSGKNGGRSAMQVVKAKSSDIMARGGSLGV